jgi:hypothetical protein
MAFAVTIFWESQGGGRLTRIKVVGMPNAKDAKVVDVGGGTV